MPACSQRCDFPSLDAEAGPHVCPRCERKIHATCPGIYLDDEPDFTRNTICYDCADTLNNIPSLRQIDSKKPLKSSATSKKINSSLQGETTTSNNKKVQTTITHPKTTGPRLVKVPRLQTYDVDEGSNRSVASSYASVIDNLPILPDPIVINIPDSASKGIDMDDCCIPNLESPYKKKYDFTVPKDVPPDYDEIENLLRIAEKTGRARPSKTNPDPTWWDHINKMLVIFVYSLAGATVSQTIPRIDTFSHHAIISQEANNIVSNLPSKK